MNTTMATGRSRLSRNAALLAALAALGLTFTVIAAPALAVTDYATVTGYEPNSSDANHPEFWEDEFPGADCFDAGVSDQDTHELPALGAGEAYVAVIVKAGADNVDPYTNTIFAEPPVAGQHVWADTNGNGAFDDDDKQISHIIVCTGEAQESEEASVEESVPASVEESVPASVEESEQASVEESQSPEGSVQAGTGTPAPSLPDGAMSATDGPSPIPTIAFGMILLASLATLAWVNVKAVRSRA